MENGQVAGTDLRESFDAVFGDSAEVMELAQRVEGQGDARLE